MQVQSAIFVAVSILCLLALRPLAARLRRPPTPTNGDLNIGRTATILTPVSDGTPGRVRLDGVDWNAQAVPGACRVTAIHSTTLIVEPAPIETPLQPN